MDQKRHKSILYLSVYLTLWFIVNSGNAHALTFHGFAEGAYGKRFEDDTTSHDDYNLMEGRIQLRGAYAPDIADDLEPELVFKGDLIYDRYQELTRGNLREGYLSLTPHDMIDLKIGRQVLTWGTGDLLFINDLFPKDYVSFFIGRDDEYLKLPSDALKASIFFNRVSADIVLLPEFEPNNSISGKRLSYYNPSFNSIVGEEGVMAVDEPERGSEIREKAARIYGTIGRTEAALYYFDGFYKNPLGVDSVTSNAYYPELTVLGFSLRGPLAGGIANLEAGYYDSTEDRHGDNNRVENSAIKAFAGFEKDLGSDLKAGIQYQYEHMLDYDEFIAAGGPANRDEDRHQWTLRLNKLAMNQNLTLGFFAFYAPYDKDYHLRPKVSYKFTDNLSATLGANIFQGEKDYTFFGQLTRNDNIYFRVRYNF
ncbi:MAG: hypothetical protein RQ824_09560 [bacterium]|nr:hypothetical protein [bacterium]